MSSHDSLRSELGDLLTSLEARLAAPSRERDDSPKSAPAVPSIALRTDLADLLSTLEYRLELWQSAKAHIDLRTAGDFSVFEYIQPGEVTLSRIIADLLDPRGSHGQQDAFAREFLRVLEKSRDHALGSIGGKIARVTRERTTTRIGRARRMDIEIEYSNDSAIVIENKPTAMEQVQQLDHYAMELMRRYRGRFLLVFLTGERRDVASLSERIRAELEENGRFLQITYGAELREWLRACQQVTRADKIRWFLEDFELFVAREFPGTTETNDEHPS